MSEKSKTFKEKMERLEQISASLKNEDLELEKMIELVDEAKSLVDDLEKILDKAQSEVNK